MVLLKLYNSKVNDEKLLTQSKHFSLRNINSSSSQRLRQSFDVQRNAATCLSITTLPFLLNIGFSQAQ